MTALSSPLPRFFLLFCFVCFVCSCAPPLTSTTSAPPSEPYITYSPTTCPKREWTYIITVPAHWKPVPGATCDVQFQDALLPPRTIASDDQNESEFFTGGIGIRGPIATSQSDVDAAQTWISQQPNHSSIVTWQPITTPIGAGRVYTLERDHVASTWRSSNPTWRGQYAYIPQGGFSIEVWVRAESVISGTVEPTLARLLATVERPK